MNNLPLLELFTQLRKAGLPLGVDDYKAVLNALQTGYGIENKAALARLCRTLWVKSKQDKQLFDYHFEQIIAPQTELLNASVQVTSPTLIPEKYITENTQEKEYELLQFSSSLRLLKNYLIPTGIFILIFGIAVRIWNANRPPVFMAKPVEEVIQGKKYEYKIKARDLNQGDIIKIEAVKYPSWLTFKSNKNGTATLSGIAKSTIEDLKDKTDSPSGDLVDKKPKSYTVELRVTDNHGAISKQSFVIKVINQNQINREEISIWTLLLQWFIIFAIIAAIVYFVLRNKNTEGNAVQNSLPSEPETTTLDESQSETLGNISEEIKGTETEQQISTPETVKPINRFIQISEYPPLTRRQMKQSWRYLRRMLREGIPTELDVEATVDRISREGVLLEPVIVPRRVNRTKLLLLLDLDGSMIPFQNLSNQLAETASKGGRLENTDLYYFHNCPIDYLYRDRYYQMAEKIDDALTCPSSHYTAALLFSDAGAARGGLNPERLEVTAQFLEQLKQQVRNIAWLNPMPRDRWFGTTAAQIAQIVPMFELSRQGLNNAIAMLRGQSGHFGASKF